MQTHASYIAGVFGNGPETDHEEGLTKEETEPAIEADASSEENSPRAADPENLGPNDEEQSKKGGPDESPGTGPQNSEGQSGRDGFSSWGTEEWDGPRELEMVGEETEPRIRFRQALPMGTTWGPFQGKIEMPAGTGSDTVSPAVLNGGPKWLQDVAWVSAEDGKNNCAVYNKGGQLWCSTTKNVMAGEELTVCAVDFYSQLQAVAQIPLGHEMYPARLLDTIQLLPQQAAMASILPSAIINKNIFPCKSCGIWYRSERNLQAHLMYYCSGRQRDPEVTTEKIKNGSHQLPRVCSFPQCNMSFSGSHALEMHLSTHTGFKMEESTSNGNSLKCTICDHTADTLLTLQQHILSHLSQVGLRCNHCHFRFQTPRELLKHQELHGHGSIKPPSEAEAGRSRAADGPQMTRPELAQKDAPHSPTQIHDVNSKAEQDNAESGQAASKGDISSGQRVSFSYTRVKSEPSSPRLASSPIQHHMAPAFPISPFMSHVPFPHDISSVPQASEILAKMSELVHRRLHHGGNSYPPMMYSTLVPKGATCFECNITFSNLDNYLVHKKHYCNSRWQHIPKPNDYASILDKTAEAGSPKSGNSGLVNILNAGGHSSEVNSPRNDSTHLNPPVFDPLHSGGKVTDELPVLVKKALTPSGAEEKPNGMQDNGMQEFLGHSPKISPIENEIDPNQTTCEACKITFSRHETYMVHKQYYCATRHDPPAKRSHGNKAPANQKSVRARKRRKAYEMTAPDQEQMPPMGQPPCHGMPPGGVLGQYFSQDAAESLREQFHPRYVIQGLVPKHPEASLTVAKSALVSKCNTIVQDEVDTPMDLSKKCFPQFGKMSLSPKGLMDYHECAVCKVSFNKVEDYLTHKQNFCPATALDNKMQHDMKKEGSGRINDKTLEKSNENTTFDLSVQQANIKAASKEKPISLTDESKNTFESSGGYPGETKKMRRDEQIWPYYEIKPTDYATGMVMTQSERRHSPSEGTEGEKDQPMPDGCQNNAEDPGSPQPKNRGKTAADNAGQIPKDKATDPDGKEHSPPLSNDCVSSSTPDSESPTEPKEDLSPSPTSKTNREVSASIKKGLNGSIPTGNVKYCRPCDIQFNNLSNFITHKKFYCSSHTAEHVK
ncbi:zinc finger protein ZFPM2b [Chanos chanos]|uniref:Zinc finger protein ZFPM2b n=1 Tax=Chanos chanos TaxID=29144 RepID=A0A6J2WIX0_CHACN|nr:zinc finger protein ZFPM2-like [Chanos chanos]